LRAGFFFAVADFDFDALVFVRDAEPVFEEARRFFVACTDALSASIRSTTSPPPSACGSGSGSPSAFFCRSSSSSLR